MKLLRSLLAPAFCIALFTTATAEEKKAPTLNSMLEERITLNAKYGKKYSKMAEDSPFAEDLVPLEKRVGVAWVNYLKYIRASDDPELKVHALRIEFLDEIRGCYYDLEYAESLIEKVNLRSDLSKWKKLLTQLDAIAVETKDAG